MTELEKREKEYCKEACGSYYYECHTECSSVEALQEGAKWGMEHATEWHDLKENPEDLPKRENQDCFWSDVLRVKDVCGGYFELQYCFEVKKWYRAYDTAFEFPSKNIVAWCYSPTYKE